MQDDGNTSGTVVYELLVVQNPDRDPLLNVHAWASVSERRARFVSVEPLPTFELQYDLWTTATLALADGMETLDLNGANGRATNSFHGRFLRAVLERKDSRPETPALFLQHPHGRLNATPEEKLTEDPKSRRGAPGAGPRNRERRAERTPKPPPPSHDIAP